ncbi:MAG: dTDP-4-dehydrorhamnose reductase [Candidatus Margulisiibacteriota bacterium]|nr:dTDP-4-dehydrorhamnose reductase [Candidatus Margulisiibacteriota bacterium]
MKILIIGADGQLGTDLCKVIPKAEQIPLTIKDIDITNRQQTLDAIKKYSPNVVINTAAYNQVDKAEEDSKLALAINRDGVKNVADACKAIDAAMVHISTDYVFDGKKNSPYVESDKPNPLSKYGKSKLAGEEVVRNSLDKYFIIRTTGLYGVAGCLEKGKTNFVDNIVKKETATVVDDERISPTYSYDLARKIDQLARTNKYGLFHIVNNGDCSWYEFAREIFKLLNRNPEKIVAGKIITKAKRPKYSVLANTKIKELGMDDLRPWQEALQAYLKEKEYI